MAKRKLLLASEIAKITLVLAVLARRHPHHSHIRRDFVRTHRKPFFSKRGDLYPSEAVHIFFPLQ